MGVGGLGSTVVSLLARLGPVRLDIWDPGIVDEPDLNRQLLYGASDLGAQKAVVAAVGIGLMNPAATVGSRCQAFSAQAYAEAVRDDGPPPSTVLFDCVDNIAARREIEESRRRWDVPVFHGAVEAWWGQVATLLPDGGGYESIYGADWSQAPPEQEGGRPIMPHVVTTIASAQIGEFLRWIEKPDLANAAHSLWYFDGRRLESTTVRLGPGTGAGG